MTPEETQAVRDEEHLRLLSLFHYVSGGVGIIAPLMWVIWIVAVDTMMKAQQTDGIPAVVLVIFGTLAAMRSLYGIVEIVAGRFISQRRARAFTMFAGLPRVLFFLLPSSALLTMFTVLVLDRQSVQELYRQAARASVKSGGGNPSPE